MHSLYWCDFTRCKALEIQHFSGFCLHVSIRMLLTAFCSEKVSLFAANNFIHMFAYRQVSLRDWNKRVIQISLSKSNLTVFDHKDNNWWLYASCPEIHHETLNKGWKEFQKIQCMPSKPSFFTKIFLFSSTFHLPYL